MSYVCQINSDLEKVYFLPYVNGSDYSTVTCGFKPKKILIGRSGGTNVYPYSCWYDESISSSTCYYWNASSSNAKNSATINSSAKYITGITDNGFTLGNALTSQKLTILAVG